MGENLKKIKAKKSWQPINIILGLLLIGSIFYFSRLQLSFIAYLRFIPAIVLILTRKNNILAFIVLFIFGLTAAFFPTGDGFLILVLAMYMFFSTILRMCKVKIHAIIGLIISLILGFSFYWDYARAFISENGLVINREMNNEIRIELGTETGKISTIFHTGEGIIPRSQELQRKTNYVYQVRRKSENIVIPLSKWPIFRVKADKDIGRRGIIVQWLDLKDVVLHGEFNNSNRFPLSLGDYTIQLIKIKSAEGTIIAESDFSVVPYDQQTISKLTAYLTVKGDPNKYYDSYIKKGSDSVTAWVQSPPGEVIGGTVKSFMTNLEGDIDETSWMGVIEEAFSTNSNGTPVSLRNLSGNPLPGVYHYQIIIDGNIIFDLKYNCAV